LCFIGLTATSCQAPPQVQIDRRAEWLDRAALRGATVALLPIVTPGAPPPAGIDRVVIATLRSYFRDGKLVEPEALHTAVHGADADAALAAAVEQFRTRTALDEAALAQVGKAAAREGAEYLVLVRLSQLSGYFDPTAGRSRQATEGLGASATVRVAIVRAADGATAFVGVSSARGDAASYTSDPYAAPLSNSEISQNSRTRREDVYSDAATPGAVVSAALSAALSKI
jgi:hypothetical protein